MVGGHKLARCNQAKVKWIAVSQHVSLIKLPQGYTIAIQAYNYDYINKKAYN